MVAMWMTGGNAYHAHFQQSTYDINLNIYSERCYNDCPLDITSEVWTIYHMWLNLENRKSQG